MKLYITGLTVAFSDTPTELLSFEDIEVEEKKKK
jgi:hypothetical protein